MMRSILTSTLTLVLASGFLHAEKPLKALLIAGGCCHDYAGQHKVLADGIQGLANVQVDVIWTDDKGTNPPLPLYDDPNWAKGYDVIIHDECAAANKDLKVLKNILNVHQTVPAVHLHCAMHSFRTGTDDWFKHLGLQSSGHGPQEPIDIEFTDDQHPITATLKDWTTIKEELYNNVNLFDAHPLAIGMQKFNRKGKEVTATAVVAWTNEKQGAPSFSTTIGHNTDTVRDPRYLELVTRGLLWSCGKLNDDYLKPFKGQNKIQLIKKPAPDAKKILGAPPKDATALKKEGNITPKIVKLSAKEEADILKDARAPEGFDLTLFAPWQTANYPVYVAASPAGDLYVSSDGNGSLGRQAHRGRVLRLRDTTHDGRADQVTEFIKDIDSPRGLIWDHDRLYLLHPPHISVYYDRDHDGIAEDSKILIEDIAFGFKDRPADHTTNGLELGIDGWIYIAGGDFGFVKATGADGRTLQHRGGGVIRFRPDGSGLELFSTGTRNILGTPMSPTLDMFARDNTNDGGGWDVRFHHFTGLEDHGYPRLYMNFPSEHIQPLADYGGGSGCGSVYIHEPGFPTEWANAPFTCDWGKAGLFRHTVAPKGATFEEIAKPEQFIKVTRPTDADVDGMSAVYQASWKGPATFGWAGPEQGYIVRVTPKDYSPEPLPNFDKLSSSDLIKLLASPSHIRTLTAQRTLIRRGSEEKTNNALLQLLSNAKAPLNARIAALYAFTQINPKGSGFTLSALGIDDTLSPYFLRALGDLPNNTVQGMAPLVINGTKSDHSRAKLEACITAARLNLTEAAPAVAKLLADPDPVIVHTAYQSLARLSAHEAALPILQDSNQDTRKAAAWALMRMHKPEVVDALLNRLEKESRLEFRRPLLSILCRLYHRDGEWKGDSWGTRPDTRGPYYQPVTWEQSERILTALKAILANAPPEEAAFIIKKLNKNRIQSNEALLRIIALATKDEKLIPDALAQLATTNEVPTGALPLILKAAQNPASAPGTLANAVTILSKSDDKQALSSMIKALLVLNEAKGVGKELGAAYKAFFGSPKLENHHLALEKLAGENPSSPEAHVATSAMITLASRKKGSPESREMSRKALEHAWQNPQHRSTIIRCCEKLRNPLFNDRILLALNDPDPEVAKAAKKAAGRLKIQIPGKDKTPKIATLKPEQALAQIVKHKGSVGLGEAIFTRATCIACHTTSQDQVRKGPYLSNISETYRRNELAEAILDPNKTIAQGFASNVITLKDGTAFMGFVTNEAGDQVTVRDIAAQEHTIRKIDIKERTTLPTSMMPPGLMNGFTVHETASLLDYLEALAKKK